MADGVLKPEGNTVMSVLARARQLTGVKERGTLAKRLPRNLGDPNVSSKANTGGKPVTKSGPAPDTPYGCWSEQQALQRYRGTKETK